MKEKISITKNLRDLKDDKQEAVSPEEYFEDHYDYDDIAQEEMEFVKTQYQEIMNK
ncbi:hypothetical protein AM571_PA00264 (plasmid) [Rhizobium etli 8C-3]|uniref:Uncharacterized protein n=2 Tax=Rhizobium etli TaxID=29449 RepID=A0A1L5PAF6_RHIET|nr:hypothetical protein AM571_PA00264 [Rhizobium etli 8C-3]